VRLEPSTTMRPSDDFAAPSLVALPAALLAGLAAEHAALP